MKKSVSVVWLKRDLRTKDHAPLFYAAKAKLPVIVLYCFEPSLASYYDWDPRHWRFVYESLNDLRGKLPLIWTCEEVIPSFEEIARHYKIENVFSSQETGTEITYERDKAFRKWCRNREIKWQEYQSNGVMRGLRNEREWERLWASVMRRVPFNVDLSKFNFADTSIIKTCHLLPGEVVQPHPSFQKGGEEEAHKRLKKFIEIPHSSKLSPHISWGNLSIRQVYQEALEQLKTAQDKKDILQFISRLKWHCHFIQQFEMNEGLEFSDMVKGFEHLRVNTDKDLLKAWKSGQTGFPLIDACMRCVNETGYLSFRKRAIVVSFLTHHLWQPWQEGAKYLARMFLDYEPGIHFPQFQLQSGVAGNGLRIYSPTNIKKEDEAFISEWIPELHESYPSPIIDISKSGKLARESLSKRNL